MGEGGVGEPGHAEDCSLGIGFHEGGRHAFVGVGAAIAELVSSEVPDCAKVGLAFEELLGVLGLCRELHEGVDVPDGERVGDLLTGDCGGHCFSNLIGLMLEEGWDLALGCSCGDLRALTVGW